MLSTLDLKPLRSKGKEWYLAGKTSRVLLCEEKTVDSDILITPRNDGRHKNEEVKPVQIVHMNISQSNIYRTDLTWLEFDDEQAAQEMQQGLNEQYYIPIFVICIALPSSSLEH